MPSYRITAPDGSIYRVTAPEGASENEVMQRVQQQAQLDAQKPPARSSKSDAAAMATEGMGWGEKALVNLGAGFDTALQGAKQIGGKVGIGPGVTDDEIREKRERDEALADTTTGGGVLQMVGEAAPTMVVPFGTAARGAQAGLRAARAIPGAARAAQAIGGGTGRLVADNALMGAAGAAIGPTTEDESRLQNALVGGTVGAALPLATRAARGGYETFTRGGAANKAAREAREAIGQPTDVAAAQRRLADYGQRAAPDSIPLTSAAAAADPGLARMEAGARARNGANFYEFDQQQGRRVSDAVMRDTADADQLAARRGTRREEWDANWQQAQDAALPDVWAERLPEFRRNLDTAMRSPEASNPAVRNVLGEVAGEIDRLGEDFTPAHLQQIRANLNARGKAIPANAYQAAPRESAAVGSLLQEVDDVMNATTQGAWGGVTDAYARGSRGVDASKAAGRVRESFLDPETGRVRGTALDPQGDVPMITEAGLGRAIDRAQGPDKVSRLSPEAQQGLARTLSALREQGIVQRVKKSATAGGGSNTAGDSFAAGALEAIPGMKSGLIGSALSGVANFAQRRKDSALVEALRNPQAMQALLSRATRAPGDLTSRERALVQALRQTAAVGAADAFE